MSVQSHAHAGSPGAEHWILRALTQNPEGLMLLAAGCALLMRKGNQQSAGRLRSAASPSRGNYGQAAEGAKQYTADIAEQTRETAASYASSAAEYAGQARRTLNEGSERIAHQAQSAIHGTMDYVLREQPLAVALAGLAAGAAIAATFPATRLERQTLGPVADQLTEAAEHAGKKLSEATAKAGETLKAATEDRGISPDGLKDVASEVAGAPGKSTSGAPDQEMRPGSTGPNGPG
jgi:ElaB/YqjD/DUF883 family membrane-anchored ribosome-binding protein